MSTANNNLVLATPYCKVCGVIDDRYDEDSPSHKTGQKHKCNERLNEYNKKKKALVKNKDGILIYGYAKSEEMGAAPIEKVDKCHHQKVRIFARPNQKVKFEFTISSDLNKEDLLILGIQLAHPQPLWEMNDHAYNFDNIPTVLKSKSTATDQILIMFKGGDIGRYMMPIMFTFQRLTGTKTQTFLREMVVEVQEDFIKLPYVKTPFKNETWRKAERFIASIGHTPYEDTYKIPKPLKILFPLGLKEESLAKLWNIGDDKKEELRTVLLETRTIIDEGINKDNYIRYFHHLLWWEETIARINLRKYNMSAVTIELKADSTYWLDVPGLAEKRPSLLRGDRALLIPVGDGKIIFESIIGKIADNNILLSKLNKSFDDYHRNEGLFNVRFLTSRVPMERMHAAVQNVFRSGHGSKIFPEPQAACKQLQPISKFYNKLIKKNPEQRSAVEHILSKTSGSAPYIVFGPPGTGKTMTIVEAIIQIVVRNPCHRVLVCTDSNMAADHIALTLLRYNEKLNINNFLLRANSENREWRIMPADLIPASNGSSAENFQPVRNEYAATFRILVTTLLHSAKFIANDMRKQRLNITHLFIDEAAQSLETAALVPISGLLAPGGQLVLAGDPYQLGPVCLSRDAAHKGLGTSLLERLHKTYKNMYKNDPNYIMTLVQNFRSHPDILKIPNELFYIPEHVTLQAKAEPDPLSSVSVLGGGGGDRAVVFHSVDSREQRVGGAPSYFNHKELLVLQRYTTALVKTHKVALKDIGIITPYIRQVYKMRDWLKQNNYDEVEIGTVESFQGKEKRVILVSTVRANCNLLDYDAKYNLGFLVDDKRFNVTITRAKSKLIIVGNAACLTRDKKWTIYMDFCKEINCYFGQNTEQLARTAAILTEVAITRFQRCKLQEAYAQAYKEYKEKKKDEKNKKTFEESEESD